ncbi:MULTISPECIES: exodeoxyribonuclease VII small subunit [Rhodanobacter]|jgi:exodeoxyribonuclease VII small subunit|uniref:Exodeoxyribonuclease 7 small subunit n=1 Tax=Rhodanobacter glycinis TaxID=582702 RepID=A0A1I4DQC5_9GAMM|nr:MULTISPECIES: exodeoxyribonuclease VII small subunit [Rhodanobacter]EIL87713.1 exodeoxyribonuclease VII small subunit [Rhodanobacter sp. 115]QEE25375.1 exodeoxyribonuclease VII small subunit [Rhodanobacter glycinis]TAM21449.1 MAG: exodeoxyribonuclease VII small subunit [Rhodanobacter sp.]SFK94161.1 Exodeoxyribonuclease VII small subunit [Rhodanobacter glycinis]
MAKSASTTAKTAPAADFEHSLDELEQLVAKMEGGDLSLDDSLASFERGIGLYRQCQQSLEKAELRVRLLLDPDAPESAEPFEPER